MNLIKRLSLTLSLLAALLAPTALAARQAQPAPAPAPAPVAAPPVEAQRTLARPALWKIADEDTTVYLFGTIHLLPKGIEWYAGPVADAFKASDELVTEIPEISDAETGAAVMKRGILPPGQSLRSGMSKKELAKYGAAMKRLGLPEATFDRFRPWYAAVVMATFPLQRQGYDLQHGVEAELAERNKAAGHPRTGLETLDFQLGLFDTFSPKVQKRYLFEVIASLPTIERDVGTMVAAWTKGDAKALAEMLNQDQSDPAMMRALLFDRNKTWARWIKDRMARPGTVFIAVGAGHLGGKGSVQDELAATGIASTRVQ